MSFILNLKSSLQLWRHGRGFGIHSPFAFGFITEVLRQEYGYYAYLHLPGDRTTLAIFRVVLDLRPDSVAMIGSDTYRRAVVEAVPNSTITTADKADLIIVDADAAPDFDLAAYADKHVIVTDYLHLVSWPRYKAAMDTGMTFANNGSMAVGVALAHLPRQDFDVKF